MFFWHRRQTSEEVQPEAHHDHALVLAVHETQPLPRWKQIRFINYILTPTEKRFFWGSVSLCLISLGIGLGLLIKPHLIEVPANGGTLTEAIVGTPKLINPLFAPLNDVDRDLSSLVYSGLFRLDAQLEPQPDLVESYEWRDNGRTLEIHLRKDARFHDNTPVTSDDVVFTYQAVRSSAWRSPLAATFRSINAIRVDDTTVQLQMDKANPQILSSLTLGILPAHIWEDVPSGSATLADINLRPIGSGPYQVSTLRRDARGQILSYRLERFNGYYGLKPHIDQWQFRFFPDRTQAMQALRNGQVDSLAFVPWSEAASIKREHVNSLQLQLPQETIAFFNLKDPLLKDINLRSILSKAIDRQELEDLAKPSATLIDSAFPFLSFGAPTTTDLESSRQALDKLGWKLIPGENVRRYAAPAPAITTGRRTTSSPAPTMPNTSSTPLVLTIEVPNQPDLLKIATYLQQRWSLIGARVEIQNDEANNLLQNALNDRSSYQIILWNILLSPDQDLSPFWSSANTAGQGFNLSHLATQQIDQALTEIQNATTSERLLSARQKLNSAIQSQTPALFLVKPAYSYLVAERIKGTGDIRISRPSDRLLQANNWYIKSSWQWN